MLVYGSETNMVNYECLISALGTPRLQYLPGSSVFEMKIGEFSKLQIYLFLVTKVCHQPGADFWEELVGKTLAVQNQIIKCQLSLDTCIGN